MPIDCHPAARYPWSRPHAAPVPRLRDAVTCSLGASLCRSPRTLDASRTLRDCLWGLLFALVVCHTASPGLSAQQIELTERPAIFDSPMDFTQPPELPEIPAVEEAAIRASIDRGIDFLLAAQNADGSWGSPTRTKDLNIYAPVPGAHDAFRTATTALGIAALHEAKQTLAAKLSEDRATRLQSALNRSETWLIEHLPKLRRATGDAIYNVWGHSYSIQALVRMHRARDAADPLRAQIVALIEQQFVSLQNYESVDGGWGYYDFRYKAARPTADSTSFTSGTALVALYEAKSIGVEPPQRLVDRAIASVKRQQKPDFSYLYGEYLKYTPMGGINRPAGSLGRTQCCNLAIRLWGDTAITDNVVKHWLWRLYLRNGWLDIGRKRPVPHEAWFQVAGYFYYYGHYYAALSIDELPAAERSPYQTMLAQLLLERQETNGSWWDYPLYNYHEPYGTGFALMTLLRCLPVAAEPASSPAASEP